MAKGNWHDELGRSGRYSGRHYITLTDLDGVSTKQQFPKEKLATGDKVTVEMTKGQQALFKKQGVEVDPENPVYQAEITELGIADAFTAEVPNPTSPAEPNKLAVPVKIGDYCWVSIGYLPLPTKCRMIQLPNPRLRRFWNPMRYLRASKNLTDKRSLLKGLCSR